MPLQVFLLPSTAASAASTAPLPLGEGPWSIGNHPAVHIPFAAQSPNVIHAHIGLSEGIPFIQPTPDSGAQGHLLHNGHPLLESAWIKNGDRIELANPGLRHQGPWQLRFHLIGDSLTVEISGNGAGDTAQPQPDLRPGPDTNIGMGPDINTDMGSASNPADTPATQSPQNLESRIHQRLEQMDESELDRRLHDTLKDQGFSEGQISSGEAEQVFQVDSAPDSPAPEGGSAPASLKARTGMDKRLRWAIGAVLSLLITAAAFVLTATSVEVHIEPEPDWSSLEGFPPALGIGDHYLAVPGNYSIHATRSGYQDVASAVLVEFLPNQRFDITMEKLPGKLNLTTEPDVPAQVRFRGQPLGQTPLQEVEIEAGKGQLTLEHPDYLPVSLPLQVQGMGVTINQHVQLEPAWAVVNVDSKPAGATVRVVGAEHIASITTPGELRLIQGQQTLEISLPKHKTQRVPLSVRAGEDQTLPLIELEPADAELTLNTTPEGVTVMLNGKYKGITPLTLPLAANTEQELQLHKAGYRSVKKTLTLEPEQTLSKDIKLRAEMGTVFIVSDPADATLKVDGRQRGKASQRLRLSTRSHRIEVSKPGYQTYHTRITPRSGAAQTLDVKLQTLEQRAAKLKARRNPEKLSTGQGQTLIRLPKSTHGSGLEMGASRREPGRRANEVQHRVQLERGFYLSSEEVTNKAFREFDPKHNSGLLGGMTLDADQQPVVNVTWDQTARYLNWLSKKDKLPPAYEEHNGKMQLIIPVTHGYRLPTEAEWAYAARSRNMASSKPATRFPWGKDYPPTGNSIGANVADLRAQSLVPQYLAGVDDGYPVTAPVGSFPANPLGLHDLAGNVSEWCLDYYAINPDTGQTEIDPLGPSKGEHHVVRGSNWRDASITELRYSYRDYSKKARPDLGFRIARYTE